MVMAAIAAAALLLASPDTVVQAAPQSDPTTVLPEVIVQASRLTDVEAAEAFIEQVSAPPLRSGSLAVWAQPLCIAIDNLQPAVSAVLRERIAARAALLGIAADAPGCTPNVAIVASADARATATDLSRENRTLFRPSPWWEAQLGEREQRQFERTDAPVRWWTVSAPVDIDTGQRLVAFGDAATPVRRYRGMMPRGGNTKKVMQWVIIVIDATQTADVPIEDLGDYLAMVTLAEIDMQADMSGQSTVLNLFRQPRAGGGMTGRDMDYLTALYASPPGWTHIRFNVDDVAKRMVEASAGRAAVP